MREHLKLDAFAEHLFVFASRKKGRVKILYWDRDGFAMSSKRPEEGTYAVPFGDGAAALGATSKPAIKDHFKTGQRD